MIAYGSGDQVRDTLSRAEFQLPSNPLQFPRCPSGFRVVSSERKAKAAPVLKIGTKFVLMSINFLGHDSSKFFGYAP